LEFLRGPFLPIGVTFKSLGVLVTSCRVQTSKIEYGPCNSLPVSFHILTVAANFNIVMYHSLLLVLPVSFHILTVAANFNIVIYQ
jgi:hypothetical protein